MPVRGAAHVVRCHWSVPYQLRHAYALTDGPVGSAKRPGASPSNKPPEVIVDGIAILAGWSSSIECSSGDPRNGPSTRLGLLRHIGRGLSLALARRLVWAFMLHDFGQVAAVDQVPAGRALLEVIRLTGRRPSVRPAGFLRWRCCFSSAHRSLHRPRPCARRPSPRR